MIRPLHVSRHAPTRVGCEKNMSQKQAGVANAMKTIGNPHARTRRTGFLTPPEPAPLILFFIIIYFQQTQGVFNVAKKLTAKMEKKGMVTRKDAAGGGGGDGGDGDSDYEIREDGVELTGQDVVRRKAGTWATVEVGDDEKNGGTGEQAEGS